MIRELTPNEIECVAGGLALQPDGTTLVVDSAAVSGGVETIEVTGYYQSSGLGSDGLYWIGGAAFVLGAVASGGALLIAAGGVEASLGVVALLSASGYASVGLGLAAIAIPVAQNKNGMLTNPP